MTNVPRPIVVLGLAGLAPQALCLALVALSEAYRWASLAAGGFYAAAILSFLGGMWWLQGLASGARGYGIYAVAVLASLLAWGSTLPWVFGLAWPAPSLVVLGVALLVSPVVDWFILRNISLPSGWLTLRAILAGGLGGLTLALAGA